MISNAMSSIIRDREPEQEKSVERSHQSLHTWLAYFHRLAPPKRDEPPQL